MNRNPYLGGNVNPYLRSVFPIPFNQPMKTPEQYQAELLKQLQPNLEAYNAQYMQYQQQQAVISNSGQYVKVGSYDEVKNIQATADGKPIIIIDEVNGFLYSKKFENGTEYIKGFKLVPNETKEEVVKTETTETTEAKVDDPLTIILSRLDNLNERLSNIERSKADGNNGLAVSTIKED